MSDDVLELLDTAPAPPMSIDPYAAVLGGRRRLRRRRAGLAGAGLAAAAVVLAVVTQLPGDASRALVPATPTPSVPTGSAITSSASAVLDFGIKRYTVVFGPTYEDPYGVVWSELAPDGSKKRIGGASAPGPGVTYGEDREFAAIIGVLPRDAGPVEAFFGGRTIDVATDLRRAPVPGTGFDAFALRLRPPLTTDDLWFLLWTDAQGRQHSTAPSDTRSAVFTIPRTADAVVLWGDAGAGSWGLVGGGLTTLREGTQTPQLQLAQHPAADDGAWQGVYGLLPAGARDIELTLPPGARLDGFVQGQALEDLDATAFLAVLDEEEPGATKEWVPRVTWTNADGSPGTYSP